MEFAFQLTEAHNCWSSKRKSTVDQIRSIANELDDLHKKVNMVTITGASVSAAGAGIAIAGLALAPFSGGATAVIGTPVGAGLGAVGGVTSAGASFIEIVESTGSLATVIKAIFDDKMSSENFNVTLQENQGLEGDLKDLLLRINVANTYLNEMVTSEIVTFDGMDETIKRKNDQQILGDESFEQVAAAEDFQEILELFDQCLTELFLTSPDFSANLIMKRLEATKVHDESDGLMFELLMTSALLAYTNVVAKKNTFSDFLQVIGKAIVTEVGRPLEKIILKSAAIGQSATQGFKARIRSLKGLPGLTKTIAQNAPSIIKGIEVIFGLAEGDLGGANALCQNIAEGAAEDFIRAGKAVGDGMWDLDYDEVIVKAARKSLNVGKGVDEGLLDVEKLAAGAVEAGAEGFLREITFLNIALLPLDIYQIISSAKDLKEGSFHPASVKLRETAYALWSEMVDIRLSVEQQENILQTLASLVIIGCTSIHASKTHCMWKGISVTKAVAKKSWKLLLTKNKSRMKEKTKEEDVVEEEEEEDEEEEEESKRISILTINVRGLRNRPQLWGLFAMDLATDVLFLQESHFLDQDYFSQYANLFGKVYQSHGTTRSRGVVTILTTRFLRRQRQILETEIHDESNDDGRCKIVDITVNGKHFRLVNIYAPAGAENRRSRRKFFSEISNHMIDIPRNIVCGGDFNVRMDAVEVSLATRTVIDNAQSNTFLCSLPEMITTFLAFPNARVQKVNRMLHTSIVTDVQVDIKQNDRGDLCLLSPRLRDVYNSQQGYTYAYKIRSNESRRDGGISNRYGASRLDTFLIRLTEDSDIQSRSKIEHWTRKGEAPLTDHSGVRLKLSWKVQKKKTNRNMNK